MGSITGASAAKKAAKAQEAALQEQVKQATNTANEAARQSAISAANAAARDSASQQVESDTLANKPGVQRRWRWRRRSYLHLNHEDHSTLRVEQTREQAAGADESW